MPCVSSVSSDRVADALREPPRLIEIHAGTASDQELFTAPSHEDVVSAHRLAQQGADLAQEMVARLVAVGAVDLP